jgi:hypothetical protein
MPSGDHNDVAVIGHVYFHGDTGASVGASHQNGVDCARGEAP